MASPINQASFIGGILAPSLRARVDLQRYSQGAADLLNFVVHPHGGISNRPGSDQIALTKTQDGSLKRLIRFAPAAEEQYILEFGEGYLRIYSGTERVTTPDFPVVASNTQPVGGNTILSSRAIVSASTQTGSRKSQAFVLPVANAITSIGVGLFRAGLSFPGDIWPNLHVAIFSDVAGVPGAAVPGYDFADFAAVNGFVVSPIPATVIFARVTPLPSALADGIIYHVVVMYDNDTSTAFSADVPLVQITLDTVITRPAFNWTGAAWEPLLWLAPAPDVAGHLVFSLTGPAATQLELLTPYTSAQIQRLVTIQSVDVMTITDPSHTNLAMELKRFTPNIWTLTPLAAFVSYGAPTTVVLYSATTYPQAAPTHEWQYAVAGVRNGVEGLATVSPVINVGADVSQSLPVPLLITCDRATPVDYLVIYKGLNGTYGFIGTQKTPAANWPAAPGIVNWQFRDENFAPDYTDQPRQGFNPFTVAGGRRPAVAAYFQQRLAFANWQGKPDTILLSETADYKTFDQSVPRVPDDAIEATLASGGLDEIRALVPLADLLIFTAAAEYVANGSNGVVGGDPILFDASPRSHRGSQWLQPIVAGDIVLFYDAAGHIREWVFDQATGSFPASDLTVLASHLFAGRQVVSWAYTQAPHSVIWLVLDDGTLLSLTYLREQSVAAWARHATQGRVRSIVTAREGLSDCLYMTVDRDGFGASGLETRQFIERMLARDAARSHFLDCAVTVSDRPTQTIRITGGPAVDGAVTLAIVAPYNVSVFPAGVYVVVTAPTGEKVRVQIVAISGPAEWSGTLLDVLPASATGVPLTTWAFAKDRWGGFSSLAGKTVGVVADGDPHTEVVVGQDGFIQLERHAADVTAGLSYVSRLETLKLSVQSADIRTKPKAISKVWLDVLDTRGAFAGQKRDDGLATVFYELRQSQLERPVTITDRVEIGIDASWNRGGALVIEQRAPLPCEILAITPEVAIAN